MMTGNVFMTLIEAVALIVGALSPEEVTESERERFLWRNAHPLDINSASRRTLSESGLFSDFQIVSLLDYISTAGAVLSRSELALIDGFDAEIAEALSFFVSFGNAPPPERWSSENRIYADTGLYGLHSQISRGESFEFSLGGAGTWAGKLDAMSSSAAVTLPGRKSRLYAGDFNLRFGQGLSAWNTMTIDDPSSAASLIRRPTGLKLSRSLTGKYAQTGLGCSFDTGPLTFTVAGTVPGLKKVLTGVVNSSRGKNDVAGLQGLFNCNWWHRRFSLGFTSVVTGLPSAAGTVGGADAGTVSGEGDGADAGTVSGDGADAGQNGGAFWNCTADFSVDFRGCFGGFDIASELAGGIGLPFRAVVSATSPRLAEHFKVGTSLRYSPSRHIALLVAEFSSRGGHSASLSFRLRHTASEGSSGSSSDISGGKLPGTNDVRVDFRYKFRWNEASYAALRVRETLDINKPESGVFTCRGDVSAGYAGIWASAASVSFSHSGKWGMVVFVEESCRATGKLSACLRAGIFSVDDWAGRLYVYEHDIPGRFNVPAMYGRGVWGSLFINWKFCRKGSLSTRLAYKSYPFMPSATRKPDRLEARIFLSFRIP